MVYDVWKIKEPEKQGTLWRPINRLMAKARYVREMQRLSSAVPLGNVFQEKRMQSTSINGNSEDFLATNGVFEEIGMDNMQSVLGLESLYPSMELFPDNFGMNPFGID